MRAGGFHHDAKVSIRWVASDECQTEAGAQKALGGVDAVLVPGGFGVRGIEGKLGALRWARERQVPTLGICLGLQCMVIEYARNVAGIEDASLDRVRPAARRTRSSRPWRSRRPSSRAPATSAARCGSAPTRRTLAEGSVVARGLRRRARSTSGTGTATRSTTATASSSRRPAWSFSGTLAGRHLVEFVELPARGAPLLRLDAGAPGVPVAAAPGAPAVRRPGRGGDRRPARRPAGRGRAPAQPADGPARDRVGAPPRAATSWRTGSSRVAVRAQRPCTRAWSGTSCATGSTSVRAVRSRREYVRHPGAVAVARPRRPRTGCCWSSSTATRSARSSGSSRPGCSTSTGSPPGTRRARELHEEADLVAGRWHVLVDYFARPGG